VTRIGPPDPAGYSPEQARVADEITRLRRGAVSGPFAAWIRHPGVADHANRLGAGLRDCPALHLGLYRIAALTAARYWAADYAWHIHAGAALSEGMDAGALERLRRGEAPGFARPDEDIAWRLLDALLRTRTVPDDIWSEAHACLGEETAVALVAACGFFSMAGMTLAAFEIPAPGGRRPLAEGER
jgi:4-carboxymuconolactone decarboxylase